MIGHSASDTHSTTHLATEMTRMLEQGSAKLGRFVLQKCVLDSWVASVGACMTAGALLGATAGMSAALPGSAVCAVVGAGAGAVIGCLAHGFVYAVRRLFTCAQGLRMDEFQREAMETTKPMETVNALLRFCRERLPDYRDAANIPNRFAEPLIPLLERTLQADGLNPSSALLLRFANFGVLRACLVRTKSEVVRDSILHEMVKRLENELNKPGCEDAFFGFDLEWEINVAQACREVKSELALRTQVPAKCEGSVTRRAARLCFEGLSARVLTCKHGGHAVAPAIADSLRWQWQGAAQQAIQTA